MLSNDRLATLISFQNLKSNNISKMLSNDIVYWLVLLLGFKILLVYS